jgi:putative endonuclease
VILERLIRRLQDAATRRHRLKSAGVGSRGEALAEEHLLRRGHRIIGRNVVRAGCELDLVCRDGEVLVFVEVKTRTNPRRDPAEAVNRRKRRQIFRAATAYAREFGNPPPSLRFDIVAVTLAPSEPPVIRHHEHAFTGDDL